MKMTSKKLGELKQLHGEGMVDREIAQEMGISMATALYWRTKLGLAPNRTSVRYAVYDRRTTAFLVEGTARECTEYPGIKESSFRSAMSRFRNGMELKYEIYRVEDEHAG